MGGATRQWRSRKQPRVLIQMPIREEEGPECTIFNSSINNSKVVAEDGCEEMSSTENVNEGKRIDG